MTILTNAKTKTHQEDDCMDMDTSDMDTSSLKPLNSLNVKGNTTRPTRRRNVVLALVPYRKEQGRPLCLSVLRTTTSSNNSNSSNIHRSNRNDETTCPKMFPWLEIPALDTASDTMDIMDTASAAAAFHSHVSSTTIGRIELLQTLWTACGCHVHCRPSTHNDDTDADKDNNDNSSMQDRNAKQHNPTPASTSTSTSTPTDYLTGRGCTTNKCADCRAVTDWSKRYLPRQWIRMSMSTQQQQQRQGGHGNNNSTAAESTTDAATNDNDAASNAATALQVSLEFKASKYPVETLVRIHRHHPDQQQQKQQQQSAPAHELPPPLLEQQSACPTTTDTTTATVKPAVFVPVRQVNLAVGDVISFDPPVVVDRGTGVGADTASASSASWAPLELQLIQLAVEESSYEDDEYNEGHVDEDEQEEEVRIREPPGLAVPARSSQHNGEKGSVDVGDDDSNTRAIAGAAAATAAPGRVNEARASRNETHTRSGAGGTATVSGTSASASTNAVSLYAAALQALQGSPMAGVSSPSAPPTPASIRSTKDTARGTPEHHILTQGQSLLAVVKENENKNKPGWTEAANDFSDDEDDRLCSQAEEYHGHAEVEVESPQVVQQQSPHPSLPSPAKTRDDEDNRKQDGTCRRVTTPMDTSGGPGLEQMTNAETEMPPLSASTTNHSAIEERSIAQPSLSKIKDVLAHHAETATTSTSAESTAVRPTSALASSKAPTATTEAYAQSRNVAHETTAAQPTPALASNIGPTTTTGVTSSRNVTHEITAAQPTPALASSKAPTTTTATTLRASHSLARSPKQSDVDFAKKKVFVLYFVERGLDMEKRLLDGDHVIEGLKEHCRQRGATILESFDKNHPPWPTHLVISTQAKVKSVMKELGFDDEQVLEEFLGQHNIVCAKRQWAAEGSKVHRPPFLEPTMMQKYLGIWPKKRASLDARKRPPRIVRRRMESPASLSANARGSNVPVVRNRQLSELFHQLSKLHQECPLNTTDDWKSYSFNVTSGRLRHLSFEITDEPEVLKRVKEVKGIGPSQMQMIKDFFETGTLQRIQELETDPRRVAMKRFMNIWGVGRVKALELLSSGYETIDQVKEAVESGKLILDRNQYIGLDCYDDIQEEMVRSEVEKIGAIITDTFKMRFPSAEITIMGSYRRGKPGCGDVDLLITHPDYYDAVPPRALGEVANDLLDQGHIAYHLTFIAGMNYDNYDNLPESIASKLIKPKPQGFKGKKDKFSGSSYMGVFHSPKGRRRRVDIKFYPYRERIFASLYFTGNGYFNRAMRLWANRKFHYNLNDHGLFKKDTSERVLEATSEKQVFEFLGLVWKEPHERDCFDAVMGKTGETVVQLEDLSKSDLLQESQEHVWID